MFYKTKRAGETKLTEEEFKRVQSLRRRRTQDLLEGYSRLSDQQREVYLRKLEKDIVNSNYSEDFISISKITGNPVYNSLIDIANERAWDVAQKDYQDKLSVTKSLSEIPGSVVEKYTDREEAIISEFLNGIFYKHTDFRERMRSYCAFRDYFSYEPRIIEALEHRVIDPRYHQYYKFYGTSGCSAKNFQKSKLEEGLLNASKDDLVANEIYSIFKEGDRIIMSEIYNRLDITKKAKAKDLEEYFKLTKTNITTSEGIKNGFKLGKRLK